MFNSFPLIRCSFGVTSFGSLATIGLSSFPLSEECKNELKKLEELLNKHNYLFVSASHICDNIWVGNYSASSNIRFLKENNIKTIIYINDKQKPKQLLKLYNKLNIKHYWMYVEDKLGFPINLILDKVYNIVTNSNSNILVHCTAGKSRSVAFIIYYIIRKYNMNYTEAYNFVKSKRKYISRCNKFTDQLKKYESV